jgi:drug/metabolite transporter (DMT)-like permease
LVPTLTPIYALFDPRLNPINDIRGMVLIPLFLVGIFIIIYGIGWLLVDKFASLRLRKRLNKILGSIAIVIGLLNTVFFIIVLNYREHPLLMTWISVGGILIFFGIILIIKKVEKDTFQK